MMLLFPLLLAASAASNPLLDQSGFADASGWRLISQRSEIAPRGWVEHNALTLSGNGNAAAYGGWERELDGIAPGSWYRLTAEYRSTGIDYERLRVLAGKLESLSPLNILARGYSICFRLPERMALRSAHEAGVGAEVAVRLHEGELRCLVQGVQVREEL